MINQDNLLSRRNLLHTGALAAAAALLPGKSQGQTSQAAGTTILKMPTPATDLPIRLGIASYTFREFDSAHLIDFMHQLKTPYLNLKDMHLPMGPLDGVAAQAAVYRAAGFTLTAAGVITFDKDEDADIRTKFEYCK